jgi:hypothetical protein
MSYDIKLKQSINNKNIMKVYWDCDIRFNDVKLVDVENGLFKFAKDQYKTILEIEDTIVNILGREKYSNLLTSNIRLTKEYGQVFKCRDIPKESKVGRYDLTLDLTRIKLYPSHFILCWKYETLVENNSFANVDVDSELSEDEDEDVVEPDPEILDAIKADFLNRIGKSKEEYLQKMDALILDVMSIKDLKNVSDIEAIEAAVIAL